MDNIDTTFYEKREKLKKICRSDFANYLRKLLIKDKCELCGSEDRLELHHVRSFTNMLDEVIEKVGIDNVELIREIMLGKQLRCESITLCKNCHANLHSRDGGYFRANKSETLKMFKCKELKKLELCHKEEIIKYLHELINGKLFKEERKELIEKMNIRRNGVMLKSISSLNAYLEEKEIPYKIISKRNKKSRWWAIYEIN